MSKINILGFVLNGGGLIAQSHLQNFGLAAAHLVGLLMTITSAIIGALERR